MSSELAQVDRLLVFPTPILNPSLPAGGGALPLASTCVGAYTIECVDHDTATGDLRVEVLPPSPCNTDITVCTYRR